MKPFQEATVNALFEETVQALTANDIARLLALVPLANRMKAPEQVVNRIAPRDLLDAVLKATASNLRLLRRVRTPRCITNHVGEYDA